MKRGSALLIVLGMLAFIVASALAFSAYMRYARLPSSYLRRTSSSRLLAKAALVEAIDIVDRAIGNDRWPGQSGKDVNKKEERNVIDEEDDEDVFDYWVNRCFIGPESTESLSVSPLCLEALAYIPAPIVNEVRYYSRWGSGSRWQTLGYDSGRFAFTAVDVSDYFDVNAVRCNPSDANGAILYGRNSSDRGRITLSHVFENAAHNGYLSECTPDKWDDFMEDFIGSDKLPLVSNADLALAMNKAGFPIEMNPFCNYILNGKDFVQSTSGTYPNLLRHMTFVTDSWMKPADDADTIDISVHQPFEGCAAGASLREVYDANSTFWEFLQNKQTPFYKDAEIFQLYDYLDENSVPLSLAMPTVERTPMLTGVGIDGSLEIAVASSQSEPTRTSEPGTPGVDFDYVKTVSTLELRGNLTVSAGLVIPFKYKRPSEGTFQAQAGLTVTFVPADCDQLRRGNAETIVTWANSKQEPMVGTVDSMPAYVVALSDFQEIDLNWPEGGGRTTEDEAILDDMRFKFNFTDTPLRFASALAAEKGSPWTDSDDCSVRVVRKFNIVKEEGVERPVTGTEVKNDDGGPWSKGFGWLPMDAALKSVVAGKEADAFRAGGKSCYPVVQVWVRVVNGEKKTVDLMPANFRDDALTGGSVFEILGDGAKGSNERPLLRFHAEKMDDSAVSYDDTASKLVVASSDQATLSDFSPTAYLADDPRFNYAPEDLLALGADDRGSSLRDCWKKRKRSGDADRDGDIFMATSDAGYLQSAYELANLCRTSDQNGTISNDKFGILNSKSYDGVARTAFEDCPANAAMWRTYSEYDNGHGADYIDRLNVVNGRRGFRVTPYAATNVLETALANPPIDWWAASTNETVNNAVHNSASSAAKYSMSEFSGAMVQLAHADIEKVAQQMMTTLHSGTENWQVLFDGPTEDGGDGESWWNDRTGTRLCGVDLTSDIELHSVDRKFLHGFWKECFANRQQLFLIFVRTEPVMMGGGKIGATPPQLGTRAVALVWRDPTLTSEAGRPHRTRVLFYRQFD